MGRYITGDLDYKFWFGVQSSSDILDFSDEESGIHSTIYYDDLNKIINNVEEKKTEFKETFNLTYKDFMKKIDNKSYLSSSNDEETKSEKWEDMSKKASWINLGEKIIKQLKKDKCNLNVYSEV